MHLVQNHQWQLVTGLAVVRDRVDAVLDDAIGRQRAQFGSSSSTTLPCIKLQQQHPFNAIAATYGQCEQL